jgi:hypothetical protein
VQVQLEGGSLEPGEYRFRYELEDGEGGRVLDRSAEPLRLRITGGQRGEGVVNLAHRVQVDSGVTEIRR